MLFQSFGAVGGRSTVQVVRFDTLLLLELLRESILECFKFNVQAPSSKFQDPSSRSQTHVTTPRASGVPSWKLPGAKSTASSPKSNMAVGGGSAESSSIRREMPASALYTRARLHCLRYHVFGLKFEVFKIRVF